MVKNYEKAKDVLKKYNQEHLLNFYDELTDEEKNLLTTQILNIDFKQILDLYESSKIHKVISQDSIEPLPYTIKKSLSTKESAYYEQIGNNIISQGKLALVTLAGGQGTRLGYKGPKGTYELDLKPKKSLFEILCDNLKNIYTKFGIYTKWYIMTSIYNDDDTKKYFEEKNYFGYPKEHIKFFKQSQLPIIDVSGKLVLEKLYKVKEASNGNGDIFPSMKKNNILDDMKKHNIEWISFSGVDNVLLDVIDPLFLGLTIDSQNVVASKTLFKTDVNDKDWIFVKENKVPSIIDCTYLSDEMKTMKDNNGKYLYREINILAHLFNISALEKACEANLPYHRAYKKNTFINEEGMIQVPDGPNIFKFETFIFDAFSMFDDILLLRVEAEDEFSPIKDFNGKHNPEIAKDRYKKKFNIN